MYNYYLILHLAFDSEKPDELTTAFADFKFRLDCDYRIRRAEAILKKQYRSQGVCKVTIIHAHETGKAGGR